MARVWDAERFVDEDLARALVRSQFPALAAERVERLGEGWDNVAHRVDGRWVFRFPRREIAAGLIETECAVLPRLAPRLPAPISTPVFAGRPSDPYPWPFAGCAYIPGRLAVDAAPDDAARAALAAPLARFLAALHAIPASALEGAAIPGDELGRLDARRRVPRALECLDELARAGLIPGAGPWRQALEDVPAPAGPACVVHGDLYAGQILLDDEHALAGVIDWGDVHLGDPASDLMIAHAFLPPEARGAFRAAYGPIDERAWRLARFRTVCHAATVALYAHAQGRRAMLAECLGALERVRSA